VYMMPSSVSWEVPVVAAGDGCAQEAVSDNPFNGNTLHYELRHVQTRRSLCPLRKCVHAPSRRLSAVRVCSGIWKKSSAAARAAHGMEDRQRVQNGPMSPRNGAECPILDCEH
jgi:hypothetical protein